MGKASKIAVGVVALACVYPLSSWLVGKEVEKRIDQQYQWMLRDPSMHLVSRDYRRGIFTATDKTVYTYGDPGTGEQRIATETHIHHGPFPGLAVFAAATAASESTWELTWHMEEEPFHIEPLPIHYDSIFSFDGIGAIKVAIPPFERTLESGYVNFDGFEGDGTLAYEDGTGRFSVKLKGRSEGGAFGNEIFSGQFSALTVDFDMRQVFEDRLLSVGNFGLGLGELLIGDDGDMTTRLKDIRYQSNSSARGELLDSDDSLNIADISINGGDFGSLALDFSLSGLHARTLADSYDGIPVLDDPAYENEGMALFARMGELLRHQPEMTLKRFALQTSEGDLEISGRAGFGEVTAEEAQSWPRLWNKLDVEVEIAAAPAFVNPRRLRDALVEEGLLVRNDKELHSTIRLRHGELTFNGEAFDPRIFFPLMPETDGEDESFYEPMEEEAQADDSAAGEE